MFDTPCSDSLPATNKENIYSNAKHTTTVLSKYISTPTITKPKSSTRAITTARVLTSAECLDIIREKEAKKKADEEAKNKGNEKEKRKSRKQKKKSRERLRKKRKLAEKAESARKAKGGGTGGLGGL